jgi:hypothetical protein
MPSKSFTAPMAILKRDGEAIGFIRSFNINESFQRGSVQGLGSLVRTEVPPILITCTASFDFYLTEFKDKGIKGAIKRGALSLEDFVNEFILADGISVDIYKKVPTGNTNAQGLKTVDEGLIGTIPKLFITSDGMNLSEGSIGGRTQSFEYLEPILYKDLG